MYGVMEYFLSKNSIFSYEYVVHFILNSNFIIYYKFFYKFTIFFLIIKGEFFGKNEEIFSQKEKYS